MPHKTIGVKRLISLLLCLCLLLVPLSAQAAEVQPGYRVVGSYDEAAQTFHVQFYIHDIKVSAGRFALGFDPAKLSLIGGESLRGTVKAGSSISVTTEGHTANDLISKTEGYVLFAWNPSSSMIDATAQDYLVATVSFTLPEGVATTDFDENTLTMHYIGENEVGWETGAWLRGAGMIDYANALESTPDCLVTFDYPGSDRAAADSRTVEVKLTDTTGRPLVGAVALGIQSLTTDAAGACTTSLPEGSYFCRATAQGYEEKIVTLQVAGNTVETVALRSSQQLVNSVTDSLEIGFADGDNASHVTRDMVFLKDGPQGTKISWSVSSVLALNEFGNVFRQTTDTSVTATATVSKDGKSARKSFPLVIAAKAAEEELPPGENNTTEEKPTEKPQTVFADLGEVPWAREQIYKLHATGVINGTSTTTFSPLLPISRGDFMALLMRMMKPTGTPGADFSDVAPSSYYHAEIALARGLGVAQGSGDNRFLPLASITRQDMITLTYRALIATGRVTEREWAELTGFADTASIAAYALTPMKAMVASGYIAGAGGRLNPTQNTSRAEAAVFLCRIYEALYEE